MKPKMQAVGRQHLSSSASGQPHVDVPVLGSQEDLGYLVNHLQVHEVVVAVEQPLDQAAFQSLIECQAWGVKVSYMADLYEKLNYSIPVEYITPAWALHAIQDRPVFDRVQLAFKRLLDVTLALVGLLLLLPLFPLVALALKIGSPGPLFYRQTRCGQAGQPFKILKFRTMSVDAERDGKARWATRGDQRITPVGRFLRKTRIDELPQLINVLRGEMSIVGPRPERPEFVASLQGEVPFYYTRLMVKPGITGWAQIHYDYGNTVQDALIKLQYDFYYLRYWSIWLDLYTIFQTIKVIFMFKGI
jgi:exopolysaccharide biosynthesis polyprenyl glycosylphosphotransferase